MKKSILFLFILNTIINAQVTWNPLYNLSNTPSATSDYHSVYSDDIGRYFVVWGDNGQIKFKYSFNFGINWSQNITIAPAGSWPVVKAYNNYVYVVFHHLASEYEILFTYSSDFGQTWSTPEIISGMDSGSQTPQLVVNGTILYVVWEQKIGVINPTYDIYFIKSTNRGQTWSDPFNISNTTGTHSRWVQLESAGNTLYCAWLESVTYPASDIYFSKSTNGGNSWTTPVNITNNERPQNRICMKKNQDGHIYIASDDIITFNFDEIYLMKSTDGGMNWSTPINITNNSGNSNTPCIEFWGNILYFTWADNSHTAPAYDNMDIFFKWSPDGGITWQDSVNLSENFEFSSRPRILNGIDGPLGDSWIELTVVWYDYSTGDAEILARRGIQYIVPVELISFEAEVINNNVTLSWATASEVNNMGFEIQRVLSTEYGVLRWEKIGFIEGSGTTSGNQFYSFSDYNLKNGKYYYRLKQIDFDGSFEFSPEIDVEINVSQVIELIQNYPNPFNPSTVINYRIPDVSFVNLKVFDILGNEVVTLVNEIKEQGEYKVTWDATGYAAGIYFYRLQATLFENSGEIIQVKNMLLLK